MQRIRCNLSCIRRWTVFGPLLILMTLLAAPPSVATASSRFPWRQYQGTTLHVLLSQSHWQQVIAQRLPEFEELTGIKLATEVYPQGQLWDVLENALKEPGRVDVFMTLPALDGIRYFRTGGIQSVNEYLQNPNMTSPDYNWEDFFPRARAAM